MTAATKNRNTPQRPSGRRGYPIGEAAVAYAGAIAVLNSTGYAVPGSTATGLHALGRFAAYLDNTDGADGAETVEVESGVFRYENSADTDEITLAEVGQVCYIVDDQTVAKTSGSSTRSPAGIIDDVDDAGVWVRMGEHALVAPAGALLAAGNLSDLDNAGTSRTNLGVEIGSDVQAYNAKLARVQIQNDATVHDAGGALATSGINLITGGTGIADFTLAAPVAGDRCEIRIDSLASGDVVVTTAEGVTFDGTNNTATLDAAAEALILVYKSATEWQIVENVGSVALSAV
jgi:hypothetical protein